MMATRQTKATRAVAAYLKMIADGETDSFRLSAGRDWANLQVAKEVSRRGPAGEAEGRELMAKMIEAEKAARKEARP